MGYLAAMSQHVHVATADHVTTIRLDRPDKKNAITLDMYVAMADALEAATGDAAIRAVVLAGGRDCFTAGNDLGDFVRAAQGGGDAPRAHAFLRNLAAFDKPLIGAVAGVAIG